MDGRRIAVLLGCLSVAAFFGSGFLRAAVKTKGAPTDACKALGSQPIGGSLRPGQPAPDFELTDAAGKKWSLAALRGKPVLLNFWATWCAPCAKEMPALESVSRRFRGALTVLTVSVDESWDAVKSFFPHGTDLPVLLDSGKEIIKLYGTEKFPETFLIDSEGRLQQLFYQADWDSPDGDRCLAALR
jgi:peroxiredoxin